MTNQELRRKIENYCNQFEENTIFIDNPAFDNSIIGITNDFKLIYDYNKMVEELAQEYIEDGETPEDAAISAEEWINYNTIRSIPYIGEQSPIIMNHDINFLKEIY